MGIVLSARCHDVQESEFASFMDGCPNSFLLFIVVDLTVSVSHRLRRARNVVCSPGGFTCFLYVACSFSPLQLCWGLTGFLSLGHIFFGSVVGTSSWFQLNQSRRDATMVVFFGLL